MEKRGEGKEGIPVLALAKCLLVSYVLTLLLLCLLALLLYKLHLTEGIVTIAISTIYVATTFTAGLLAGKRMEKQKFLWGAFMGAAYFVILAVVSVLPASAAAWLCGVRILSCVLVRCTRSVGIAPLLIGCSVP